MEKDWSLVVKNNFKERLESGNPIHQYSLGNN